MTNGHHHHNQKHTSLPSKRSSENDSMSLHLLVEQAIYDSADYEILSYEEVESLKKEHTTLMSRIDATKRKLVMESKVRDAAQSLSRLSSKKVRRSATSQDINHETDEELMASNRKCEELSRELHRLEIRAMEIQRRLLQHSTGILGSTHRTVSSPSEEEYMFAKDPEVFDDRSFYRTADKLEGFGEVRNSTERRMVEDTFLTERLEEFNSQLNQLLSEAGGPNSPEPPRLPDGQGRGVDEQLALLDHNIQFLRQYPPSAPQDPNVIRAAQELERTDVILTTLWDMIATYDEEVRAQKMNQRQADYNPDYPGSDFEQELPEFTISAFSSKVQSMLNRVITLRSERDMLRERASQQERGVEEDMAMMQEDLRNVENQVGQLSSLLEQRETDLATTNGKMQGLVGELNMRSAELEESRVALGQKSEELMNVMYQLDLERAKDQQRADEDLQQDQSTVEAEREARADLERELEELDKKLADREKALMDLETKYQDMKEDRDVTKAELEAIVEEADGRLKFLEDEIATLKEARKTSEEAQKISTEQEKLLRQQLDERDQEIQRMDQEIQELSAKVAELSTEVVMAKAELDLAYGSKSERAAATAEARAAAQALERANKQPQTIDPGLLTEIETLEKRNGELINEIVMLKNERAEGANNEHLQKRCKMLQKELDDMLKDFENLTKQSIEAEQERSKLEQLCDMMKEKLEHMETALAEEKIRFLGAPRPSTGDTRSPAGRVGGDSTTINVLKQEFKKMMRDMRADQARALRVILSPDSGFLWSSTNFRIGRARRTKETGEYDTEYEERAVGETDDAVIIGIVAFGLIGRYCLLAFLIFLSFV